MRTLVSTIAAMTLFGMLGCTASTSPSSPPSAPQPVAAAPKCGAAPAQTRRFVAAGATLYQVGADNVDGVNPDNAPFPLRIPANSEVDLVRLIDREGYRHPMACGLALVRVVDEGAGRMKGRLLALPPEQLMETREGATPAESASARRRAAKEMGDEEMRTGRCADEHVERLREARSRIERILQGLTSSPRDPVFTMTAHKFVVATSEGSGLSLDILSSGENHLFAVSFTRETKLDVQDEQGYPVKTDSPLEDAVRAASSLATHSRILSANARSSVGMKVRGAGCTLVIAVRKD